MSGFLTREKEPERSPSPRTRAAGAIKSKTTPELISPAALGSVNASQRSNIYTPPPPLVPPCPLCFGVYDNGPVLSLLASLPTSRVVLSWFGAVSPLRRRQGLRVRSIRRPGGSASMLPSQVRHGGPIPQEHGHRGAWSASGALLEPLWLLSPPSVDLGTLLSTRADEGSA